MESAVKKILLVEDDPIIALDQAEIISRHGFEVITVSDGNSAVEMIVSGKRIDLVLMDINLGEGMDGTEAARRFLETVDIPVLFLSGHTEPEVVSKTEKIASYGYVVKNSGEVVLIASIQMAFRLYEAHRKIIERDEILFELSSSFSRLTSGKLFERASLFIAQKLGVSSVFVAGIEGEKPHARLLGGIAHGIPMKQFDAPLCESIFCGIANGEIVIKDNIRRDVEYDSIISQGWCESSAALPLFGGSGNVIGMICVVDSRSFPDIDRILSLLRIFAPRFESEIQRLIFNSELQKSEEKYRRLFELIDDPVVALRSETAQIMEVNNSALQVFGYALDEVSSLTMLDLSAEPEETLRNIRDISSDMIIPLRRLIRKDGSRFPVEIHARPFYLNGEKMILAVLKDVTLIQNTQEKLSRTRTMLDLSLEAINASVFENDFRSGSVVTSPALYRYLGYADSEIPSTMDEMMAFINSDDLGGVLDTVMRNAKGEIPYYYAEFRMKRHDGSWIWVNGMGHVLESDEQGNPLKLIGISMEIDEKKKMEDALKENQLHLVEAQKIAHLGSWKRFLGSDEILCSGELRRIYGWAVSGSVYFDDYMRMIHPDDRDALSFQQAEALAGRSEINLEYRIIRSDGSLRHLYEKCRFLFDRSGNLEALEGIVLDITDRKIAQMRLSDAVTAKDALLSELQHRMRNTLSMINSIINIEKNNIPENLNHQVFDNIEGRIRTIASLYSMLFSSSDLVTVNLGMYLNSVAGAAFSALKQSDQGILFNSEFDSVIIDPRRATVAGLILNELLTNSLKYSPADGEIRISLESKGNLVKLSVRDSGNGLPDGFDIDASERMGLKLVKLLSLQLGGEFSFQTGGSPEFFVLFPL